MFFKLIGMGLVLAFILMGWRWAVENIHIKKSNKRKTDK